MTVEGSRNGDVFVDDSGKLWRVVATWEQPTVIMEEIERENAQDCRIIGNEIGEGPTTLHGGVHGCMWYGFKRIWRKGEGRA